MSDRSVSQLIVKLSDGYKSTREMLGQELLKVLPESAKQKPNP